MKVLHLLVSGEIGGIEILLKNYKVFSNHENTFAFVWGGGEIADKMAADRADIEVWFESKINYLDIFRRIIQTCDQKSIDAVVVHHEAPLLRLSIVLIKILRPKIKTCVYKHSVFEEIPFREMSVVKRVTLWMKMQMIKLGYHMADGVIAISECAKESIVKYMGISSEKIAVIYNGVPVFEFYSKKEKSLNTIRLIYVGRLLEVKGVQNIIPAMKIVRQKYDITLDIVGEGSYRKTLEELAKQHGISDIVRFCGACMDVPVRLANSDIFIHMPVWEEGFGITIVEAMAAGCICVCGAKGAIPEIIQDGVNGYLIRSVEYISLADVLLKVIPSYLRNECEQISELAIERARDFSIQNYSEKLDNYLQEI